MKRTLAAALAGGFIAFAASTLPAAAAPLPVVPAAKTEASQVDKVRHRRWHRHRHYRHHRHWRPRHYYRGYYGGYSFRPYVYWGAPRYYRRHWRHRHHRHWRRW